MIDEKDFWHGAALAAMVNDSGCISVEAIAGQYGHCVVNGDRRIFVKYRTESSGADGLNYQFSLTRDELRRIKSAERRPGKTFVVPVCGNSFILAIETEDLWQVVDPTSRLSQSVTVWREPGSQLRIRSTKASRSLGYWPLNLYPRNVLE